VSVTSVEDVLAWQVIVEPSWSFMFTVVVFVDVLYVHFQ